MYTIRPGDSLPSIARRYGLPLERLLAANPKLNGSTVVSPGQALTLPGLRDAFEVARPSPGGVTLLQRGSTGAAVLSLQKKLMAKGFLSSDQLATGRGIFGPRTEAAVRNFQQSRGLPVTGAAGAPTLAALVTPPRVSHDFRTAAPWDDQERTAA